MIESLTQKVISTNDKQYLACKEVVASYCEMSSAIDSVNLQ